jgi:hypothetical protein
MHLTLLPPEYDYLGPISATDVETVLKKYHLWTGERNAKVRLSIPCPYDADYNKLIWHTELHRSHYGGSIIA